MLWRFQQMWEAAQSSPTLRPHLLRNMRQSACYPKWVIMPILPIQNIDRKGWISAKQLCLAQRNGQHQRGTREKRCLQVLQAAVPGHLLHDQQQLEEARHLWVHPATEFAAVPPPQLYHGQRRGPVPGIHVWGDLGDSQARQPGHRPPDIPAPLLAKHLKQSGAHTLSDELALHDAPGLTVRREPV